MMLISGTDDGLWPSTRMGEMVIERLKAHEHPFPAGTCDTRERDT